MYENAQYVNGMDGEVCAIRCTRADTTLVVPLDPANSDFAAIMALVEAGELVIAPAENTP